MGRTVPVDGDSMELEFTGELWYWRGPAPYFFVSVPEPECQDLQEISPSISYGWGMIPVRARIGWTAWETSLFPMDGGYVVPVKIAVRRAEKLDEGDPCALRLTAARSR